LSGITQVSRYQKGKTNLDFTEARDSDWQWHQLGHMHVCTSLQTDNHTSTSPLKCFTGRMPFLPPNQQRQSTEGPSHCQTQKKKLKFSAILLTDFLCFQSMAVAVLLYAVTSLVMYLFGLRFLKRNLKWFGLRTVV